MMKNIRLKFETTAIVLLTHTNFIWFSLIISNAI